MSVSPSRQSQADCDGSSAGAKCEVMANGEYQLRVLAVLMEATARAGSRQTSAATASALYRVATGGGEALTAESLELRSRLDAVAPVLSKQLEQSSHSGRAVASADEMLRRNAALHAFSNEVPFGQLSPAELRKLQRGGRRRHNDKEASEKQKLAAVPEIQRMMNEKKCNLEEVKQDTKLVELEASIKLLSANIEAVVSKIGGMVEENKMNCAKQLAVSDEIKYKT